jgi:hypothetical protein
MRLSTILSIALGVFLGGVALRLLDHVVTNIELNLATKRLTSWTRPIVQHLPQPVSHDRDSLPTQPVAAAKPCQVTNSRGETFSCSK